MCLENPVTCSYIYILMFHANFMHEYCQLVNTNQWDSIFLLLFHQNFHFPSNFLLFSFTLTLSFLSQHDLIISFQTRWLKLRIYFLFLDHVINVIWLNLSFKGYPNYSLIFKAVFKYKASLSSDTFVIVMIITEWVKKSIAKGFKGLTDNIIVLNCL